MSQSHRAQEHNLSQPKRRLQNVGYALAIAPKHKASISYQPTHFHIALHNGNDNKALCANTRHFQHHVPQRQQRQGLMRFILRRVKRRQTMRPCARARDTIISRRTMATMITTWLQQLHMSSLSPLCAGARASFCNTLHCTMARTTKQQWQQ
jgi:hypothetical protein